VKRKVITLHVSRFIFRSYAGYHFLTGLTGFSGLENALWTFFYLVNPVNPVPQKNRITPVILLRKGSEMTHIPRFTENLRLAVTGNLPSSRKTQCSG
jgi:hypothetical protein